MTTPREDIPPSATPGKDAWNRIARIERLMLKARDLAVRATYACNASYAVPSEYKQWAKDLRRDRMSILGSLARFYDMVDRRHMGVLGQQLKQEAAALAQEFAEIDTPASAPKAEPDNKYVVDISSETPKNPKARVTHVVKYNRPRSA